MRFSQRMDKVHRSYIREILKVTAKPEVISFAGGLPNPNLFPASELQEAAQRVFNNNPAAALQYSTTEGYLPLREFIAARYAEKYELDVSPDEIIITTGSQQALDLVGKVFVDPDDKLLVEKPGYLGSLQCFSMYGPEFVAVELTEKGVDTHQLEAALKQAPRLFYAVTNFQNPSGVTYDLHTRQRVAELLAQYGTMLVEDNPYGDLRFMGDDLPPIRTFMRENAILLGSFSKTVAPGMRLGWICAPREAIDGLVRAKQAADLHTPSFTQHVLYEYLKTGKMDEHILSIRKAYAEQREVMVRVMREKFPENVSFTEPEGGMFLWVTLPEGVSSVSLFEKAIKRNVAFVPGAPFFTDDTDNALRLNFSNATIEQIEEGMTRLAEVLVEHLGE